MKVARPASPFLLGRRKPLALAVLLRGHGSGDRGRSAGGEGFEQPLLVGVKRGAVIEPIDRDQRAVPLAAVHQRHDQAAVGGESETAKPVPQEPDPVRVLLKAQRAKAAQRGAGNAGRGIDLATEDRRRNLACSCDDDRPAVHHALDHHRPRRYERPAAFGDQLEHRFQIGLGADRLRDLNGGVERLDRALELHPLRFRIRVPARMIDRDPGELRHQHHGAFVHLGERAAALLVGQVEIPERLAGNEHGHAEERRHRRMPGREAVGVRVSADVVQTQRPAMRDQLTQHAAPERRSPDLLPRPLVDTGSDEAIESAA